MSPSDDPPPPPSTALTPRVRGLKHGLNIGPEPAFAAQILGAPGARRGLRGGPQTLDAAKSTYLETEWSGEANRRAPIGGKARTKV